MIKKPLHCALLALAAGLACGALQAQTLAPANPAQSAPGAPVGTGVSHDGRAWMLQAQGMPRGQLAQQLARLSGTALHATPALMDRAAPVSASLRTRSLADAWRAVLGDEFSHALQCDAARCQVWVTGLLPRQAARPGIPGGSAMPLPDGGMPRMFTSDPPGLFPTAPVESADVQPAAARS